MLDCYMGMVARSHHSKFYTEQKKYCVADYLMTFLSLIYSYSFSKLCEILGKMISGLEADVCFHPSRMSWFETRHCSVPRLCIQVENWYWHVGAYWGPKALLAYSEAPFRRGNGIICFGRDRLYSVKALSLSLQMCIPVYFRKLMSCEF